MMTSVRGENYLPCSMASYHIAIWLQNQFVGYVTFKQSLKQHHGHTYFVIFNTLVYAVNVKEKMKIALICLQRRVSAQAICTPPGFNCWTSVTPAFQSWSCC